MRKRVIIVPKDKKAEQALDINEAKREQLIELTIDEKDFIFIYQTGIIELINREGNANVDDFEDDCVSGKENLSTVINALSLERFLENTTPTQQQLLNNILKLFNEAFDRGTGVYFYF